MDTLSRFTAASMMRRLAWCGMKRARSSGVTPFRDRIRSAQSPNIRTATLKTSFPFMRQKCIRLSTVSWVAGYREPPAGWMSSSP